MIKIETRKRTTPEISMAPLVDCMLLLLIFFLLTSSFSEKRGIKLELPRSTTAEITEQDVINILLADTGEIMFGGKTVTGQELTEALKTTVSEQGKKPVFMLADRLVPLEKVTEVIDCVRSAKLETISIATRSSSPESHEEKILEM